MTSFEAFLIRWPRESRRLSIPSVDQSTKPSVRRRPSCPCVTGLRSRSRARDRWSDVGPPRVLPEPGMSRLPPPPPAAHPQLPVRPRPTAPGSCVNHFPGKVFFVPSKARGISRTARRPPSNGKARGPLACHRGGKSRSHPQALGMPGAQQALGQGE